VATSHVRLAHTTNFLQTTNVRPSLSQAARADHGKVVLLNRNLGDKRSTVERQGSKLVSSSASIEKQKILINVVDVITSLVIARVFLRKNTSLEESERLVQDGPERRIVASIGQDSRSDHNALSLEVVKVGLLDDL
jgi:hypothetical protein